MTVQLSGKEYVSNLVGLGFELMLSHIFLSNYLRLIGVQVAGQCGRGAGWWAQVEEVWGGGPMWRRAAGRGGADHDADWTELTIYCIYEYKYTKY
jgi:hypothetical protein